MTYARIAGIIGLLAITVGIFAKNERQQDIIFVIGGLGLLAYSIALKDPIFIPLQLVFVSASAFELVKLKRNKK